MENYDSIKRLFEKLKTIGFFGRLFSWGAVKNQLVEAAGDLQGLLTNAENSKNDLVKANSTISNLNKDVQTLTSDNIRKDLEIDKQTEIVSESNSKITKFSGEISVANTTIENNKTKINELSSEIATLSIDKMHLTNENKRLTEENVTSGQSVKNLTKRNGELDIELAGIKSELKNLRDEVAEVKKQNTQLLKDEDFRKTEHSNSMSSLNDITKQIQAERAKELEERSQLEIDRLKHLKETWAKHQENAKNTIKTICSKHTVEYITQVPFKGEPDNTLKICDEFVIFDAKSPATDDLSNFQNYLKFQAESAKKYAKQENVKPDIFFVVPTNTLEILSTFVFNLADYNVFVISVDALEQIILSLKKIEEYEFAEQLSPDERDNICRVLGKFAHLTKRRIQIDSFFAKQFIELAYKSESDLPKDILEKVIEFERSEKLNPPIEKRAKTISIKELEKDTLKVLNEANSKGISMEDDAISLGINQLPLYTDTNEEGTKQERKKKGYNPDSLKDIEL